MYRDPNRSAQLKEKRKNTWIEKYGTDHIFKNEVIKEKIKQTCLERYGVEFSGQTDIKNEKTKETCLNKYGVDHIFKSDEIKEKIKETWLNKYGFTNPNKNEIIKEKIKQTCLEKYDVNCVLQSEIIKEKIKQTCLDRYGVEHPSKTKVVKEKIKQTCLDRYGVEYFVLTIHNISNKERELLSFVKQYFPNSKNDKRIIYPKELDIVIPEIKLAIEFNGSFWHSIDMKETNYHLNKILECNKKGYRLIHIWEDEWDIDKNLILDKLKKILLNNEILNFDDEEILLDRSWYNNILIPNYKLIDEISPENILRNSFLVENCGYLKYKKCR